MSETSDRAQLPQSPRVSVVVITYRQEEVLAEAVDSIAGQVTDFPFEIIVAEDNSPDRTREVALALQRTYPALVRVVFTGDNKGMNRNFRFALSQARAPYVALCEGDDFWIDPHKLQRQVDALDRHPDIDLAITRGYRLTPDGRRELGWDYGETERRLTVNELFAGAGQVAPSASLMWRAAALAGLPDWFDDAAFGDLLLILAASARGGASYDPKPSVCYRVAQANSFTNWFDAISLDRRIDHLVEAERLLRLGCAHYRVDPHIMRDRFHDFSYAIARWQWQLRRPFSALRTFAKLDPGLTLHKTGVRLQRLAKGHSASRC